MNCLIIVWVIPLYITVNSCLPFLFLIWLVVQINRFEYLPVEYIHSSSLNGPVSLSHLLSICILLHPIFFFFFFFFFFDISYYDVPFAMYLFCGVPFAMYLFAMYLLRCTFLRCTFYEVIFTTSTFYNVPFLHIYTILTTVPFDVAGTM